MCLSKYIIWPTLSGTKIYDDHDVNIDIQEIYMWHVNHGLIFTNLISI